MSTSEENTEEGRTNAQPSAPTVTLEKLHSLFPQLEIQEEMGRGGMGVVYKARHKHLDRLVALKLIHPSLAADPAFAERFSREARTLARLSHPNIIAVHDFGENDGLFYLIMEYVDGLNLRQVLRAGRLAPREALVIIPKICDALQYAHDRDVVHRDIKPENILLTEDGEVKIADFGLAKLVGKHATDLGLTDTNQVLGTPKYMAPEQVEHPGDVDHRVDIYSLGVVFYELLTGETPLGHFAPPSRKVLVDVRLDEVVLRALSRDRELRYQRVGEMKTDVEAISQPAQQPAAWMWKPLARLQAVLEHLQSSAGDLNLAYATAATLVLAAVMAGIGAILLGAFCVLFSFVLARAALVYSSPAGDSEKHRWLVYPTLIPVYLAVFPALLLWPLGGALGATLPLAEGGASTVDLGAAGRFQLWAFATYLVVAATSLWWSLLGIATWIRPEWVRTLFRPFADRFQGRHGMLFFLTSLLIFLASAAVGGLTLFG